MNSQILFEAWIERLPTTDNIHMSAHHRLDDDEYAHSRVPFSNKHNYYKKMLLKDEVSGATKAYTSNLSSDLNRALLNFSNTHDEKMPKKLYHMMERDINADIHSAPSPDEDLYVYSGIKNFNPANMSSRFIHVPHFVSTSLLPHVAKEFSRAFYTRNFDGNGNDIIHQHVLRFKIPAYSNHGLYLANHSAYPKEEEFLLRNSNVFHIEEAPHTFVQQFANGNEKHIHLWDTHILNNADLHNYKHEDAVQEKLYIDSKLEKQR